MKRHLLALVFGLHSIRAYAHEPDYLKDLSDYRPEQHVSGTIRVWGNPYIPELMAAWQAGFKKHHPKVTFSTDMAGTEAAMAGLYAGIADIAFIGRETYKPEVDAFVDWFGYRPTEIKITSGSYATQHKTFALMVYVHKDNPLTQLSLAQLDALYGVERRRGYRGSVSTWGDLGVRGEWAARPVHVYGYNFDTGMAGFFRHTVMKDSDRWNPALKEFDNGHTQDGSVINAGTYILDTVAKDKDGIGFANVLFENPNVKRIALAEKDGGPYVEPTKENAWRRIWPLTRYSTVVINRVPGQAVDPKVREFMRYILSRDGMRAVVEDAAFLPLNAETIEHELKILN